MYDHNNPVATMHTYKNHVATMYNKNNTAATITLNHNNDNNYNNTVAKNYKNKNSTETTYSLQQYPCNHVGCTLTAVLLRVRSITMQPLQQHCDH
jgi:hypothetical protein